MMKGLRSALALTALSCLAGYGCSSVTADADGANSQKNAPANQASGSRPTRPAAASPHSEPAARATLEQSADASGESIGSAALERKLDQLEKNIQSAP